MGIALKPHQIAAAKRLRNGSILCGDVGSGKSRTAIAYYIQYVCGGKIPINGEGRWEPMTAPRDLFIITTAKKRDSLDWEKECAAFTLSNEKVNIKVDSWNNIKKYKDVTEAFFIFDEQRVVGSGPWVKAFLNITRKNEWILLSATPGDAWKDYIPVFVANGFYKNKTEFMREHVLYDYNARFPKIKGYIQTSKLNRYRRQILVQMDFKRHTKPSHKTIRCTYDKELYKTIWRDRWDIFDGKPIEETGKLFYLMRKVVNMDQSRIDAVYDIVQEKKRVIIFYNFSFELELLREMCESSGIRYAEWNGEKHEEVPKTKEWVYLVQYVAGAEGWNCITTDTIIFYSQTYSYRMLVQAAGRIDRMNTPYENLYYYHFKSFAPIDLAIEKALKNKKNFNEKDFLDKKGLA